MGNAQPLMGIWGIYDTQFHKVCGVNIFIYIYIYLYIYIYINYEIKRVNFKL